MNDRDKDRVRLLDKGDLVRVDAGPFEGMSFRVVETTDGSVRGVLSLRGRISDIEAPKGIVALV